MVRNLLHTWHLPILVMLLVVTSCVKENIVDNSVDNGFGGSEITVQDIDGNTYRAKRFGALIWMTDNLRTTRYSTGAAIPRVEGDAQWAQLTTPAYCAFNNDDTNAPMFGLIYNQYAAANNNLCPTGWRVPSNEEWISLISMYGGNGSAGLALMESGGNNWDNWNTANNESGFRAVGGGSRTDNNGAFLGLRTRGYYWSRTAYDSQFAYPRMFHISSNSVWQSHTHRRTGMCVRCVKD